MKLNARVAIYVDVEFETPEGFDPNDYDADLLIDRAFELCPEPYDTVAGRVIGADGYEVLSIWDEYCEKCFYVSY